MAITGNSPLNLLEPMFTHGEAVKVTGITSRTLSQWQQRNIASDVGEMHRTGRRLYSILDLVELRVIGDLVSITSMQPSIASAAARYVRERALELSERDENGTLKSIGQSPNNRRLAVLHFNNGKHSIRVTTYKDRIKELEKNSIPFPQVILPLDDIAKRVINDVIDMMEDSGELTDVIPKSEVQ